jgi:hypothetical protein
MQPDSFIRHRLDNQRLLATTFQQPADVVQWFGAVQAQDYAGAKWALGMRLDPAATVVSEATIERAFDAGTILRTHVLRPTWHFATPADIRWLLDVTAPRVHQLNAFYYRKSGVDDDLYGRARRALIKALEGSVHLTRDELRTRLGAEGIPTDVELRMAYILMRAELDGLICSGPRRGKQFTYALLDERVPPAPQMSRDEALAELARRFFISHGPATAQDLARWASLTIDEARIGLAANTSQLQSDAMDGVTYWFSGSAPPPFAGPLAHLLSVYDEYVIGYKEWSTIVDDGDFSDLRAMGNNLTSVILVDGRIVGTWKRTIDKRRVTIFLTPFRPLAEKQKDAIAAAAQRFGAFFDLPVTLA